MLQTTYVEGLSNDELDAEIATNEKNLKTYAGDSVVTKEVKQDLQQLKQEKKQRGGADPALIASLIQQIEDLQARVKKLEEVQRPEQYNPQPDVTPEQEAEHDQREPDLDEAEDEIAAETDAAAEENKGYSPADTGMKVVDLIGKLCAYEDDDIIIVSDGQITIFNPNNMVRDLIDVHDQLASG